MTLRDRIKVHLQTEWRFESGSSWQSFAALAGELGAPVEDVKSEVRAMAKDGILRYSPLVDDCGVPAGSGYLLTDAHDPEFTAQPEGERE